MSQKEFRAITLSIFAIGIIATSVQFVWGYLFGTVETDIAVTIAFAFVGVFWSVIIVGFSALSVIYFILKRSS